jgi:hypothetical protein
MHTKQTHKVNISGSTCSYCRPLWLQKAKASTVLSRLKRNKAKVALRLAHSIMPQQQQQLLDLRQSALIAGGRGSQCAENCSTSRENFNLISRQRNELMLRVSGAIISKKPWTGASERARVRATCRFTLFRGAPYCEGEKMVLRSGSQKSISHSTVPRKHFLPFKSQYCCCGFSTQKGLSSCTQGSRWLPKSKISLNMPSFQVVDSVL